MPPLVYATRMYKLCRPLRTFMVDHGFSFSSGTFVKASGHLRVPQVLSNEMEMKCRCERRLLSLRREIKFHANCSLSSARREGNV